MRPGQNKRMRGRPMNNRRGPNPLTRSYESNGPDVKIRGNAHHVAEKYLQLARDAHTGGDPVAAENYLQHAEHYFRILSAAQLQQQQYQNPNQNQGQQNYQQNGGPRPQVNGNGNVNGNVNGNGDGSMQPVIGSAPVFSLAEAADDGDDDGDEAGGLE